MSGAPTDTRGAWREAKRFQGLDQVWAVIRLIRRFYWWELKANTNTGTSDARKYLGALVKGGFVSLENDPDNPLVGGRYELVRDVGPDRPRLRADGAELPEMGRARQWRTMKMLGAFTWRELAAHAQTTEGDAKDYIARLLHAGFLAVVEPARPGRAARLALHRHMNTGPIAPRVTRQKRVYDPNTGLTHPQEGSA